MPLSLRPECRKRFQPAYSERLSLIKSTVWGTWSQTLLLLPPLQTAPPRTRVSAVLPQTTGGRQRQHTCGRDTASLEPEPTPRRRRHSSLSLGSRHSRDPGLQMGSGLPAALSSLRETAGPSPAHLRRRLMASFIKEKVAKAKADTKGDNAPALRLLGDCRS